jgi:glutamyl-tRNA synthetase
MQFRDEGYLPQALLNYLVRLGWSHGDQEIFSIDEMVNYFELADVNSAASAFNMEKLLWLNHQYLMHSDPEVIKPYLMWHLVQLGIDPTVELVDLLDVIKAQRERCKTLVEMAQASLYFYRDFQDYEPKAAKKAFVQGSDNILLQLSKSFAILDKWEADRLHTLIKETADNMAVGLGKVAQPLRIAVCGCGVSPSIDITLQILGKEKTLSRLQRAIAYIQANV